MHCPGATATAVPQSCHLIWYSIWPLLLEELACFAFCIACPSSALNARNIKEKHFKFQKAVSLDFQLYELSLGECYRLGDASELCPSLLGASASLKHISHFQNISKKHVSKDFCLTLIFSWKMITKINENLFFISKLKQDRMIRPLSLLSFG